MHLSSNRQISNIPSYACGCVPETMDYGTCGKHEACVLASLLSVSGALELPSQSQLSNATNANCQRRSHIYTPWHSQHLSTLFGPSTQAKVQFISDNWGMTADLRAQAAALCVSFW